MSQLGNIQYIKLSCLALNENQYQVGGMEISPEQITELIEAIQHGFFFVGAAVIFGALIA